jgi:hypothetical protein
MSEFKVAREWAIRDEQGNISYNGFRIAKARYGFFKVEAYTADGRVSPVKYRPGYWNAWDAGLFTLNEMTIDE